MINQNQKQRDYQKYKKYQRQHDYVLREAEDPSKLTILTIEQLLSSYTKVENIYKLRDEYRKKYYTPDQWDQGHEEFFKYLLDVMNIYLRALKLKYRDILIRIQQEQEQQRGKEEITQETDDTVQEIPRKLNEIQKNIEKRKREEEEVWGLVIPQLIKENMTELENKIQVFNEIKQRFQSVYSSITNIDTIDVIAYIVACIRLIQGVKSASPRIIRSVKKGIYPINNNEYIDQWVGLDFLRKLNEFFNNANDQQLRSLILTITNITAITREYYIIRIVLNSGLLLFIPAINLNLITLNLINQTVVAYEPQSDILLYTFTQNLPKYIYRLPITRP